MKKEIPVWIVCGYWSRSKVEKVGISIVYHRLQSTNCYFYPKKSKDQNYRHEKQPKMQRIKEIPVWIVSGYHLLFCFLLTTLCGVSINVSLLRVVKHLSQSDNS